MNVEEFELVNKTLQITEKKVISFDLGKHLDVSFDKNVHCDQNPDDCAPICDNPPDFELSTCFSKNFSDASMDDVSINYVLGVEFSKIPASTKAKLSWAITIAFFGVLSMLLSAVVLFIRELIGIRLTRAHIRRNLNFAMFGGGLVSWLFLVLLASFCTLSVIASPVGRQIMKLSRLWLCPYGKKTIVCTVPDDERLLNKFQRLVSLVIWYVCCVPILIAVHIVFFFVNSISLMSYSTHIGKVSMLVDVILNPFTRDFVITNNDSHQDLPADIIRPGSPLAPVAYVPVESEEKEDEVSPINGPSRMELEGVQEI